MTRIARIEAKLDELLAIRSELAAALERIAYLERVIAERTDDSIDKIIESCRAVPAATPPEAVATGNVLEEVPVDGETRIRRKPNP